MGLVSLAPSVSALAATDLTPGTTAVISGTGTTGATLRDDPSYDATVLLTVSEGTSVALTEGPLYAADGSAWYGVTLWGETGYLPAYVLTSPGSTTETTAAVLEQATEPLAADEPVFTAAQTTSGETATVAYTNGDGVRCRSTPDYSGEILGVVPEGATIALNGPASGQWQPTTCDGMAGFVHTDFVLYDGGATAPVEPTAAPAEPAAEVPEASTTGTGGDGEVSAAAVVGYGTVVGTNGDGVRCRTGASYSASTITVLSEGSSVALRGVVQGEWQPVVCAGMDGFAFALYIGTGAAAPTTPPTSGGGTVSGYATVVGTGGQGVRCRSAASYSASTITVLSEGSSVALRGAVQGEWQPVVCAGSNGFAFAGFLGTGSTTPPAATPAPATPTPGSGSGTVSGYGTIVGTGGQGVRCRSAASYSASTITVLAEGSSVALRGGVQGEWQPVVCAGMNGFAYAGFIGSAGSTPPANLPAPTAVPTVAPTAPPASQPGLASGSNARVTSSLNLRYQPSYSAGVAAVASAGTVVRITGSAQSGFYPVDWDGLKGFMFGEYLVATTEALSERGGSASPAPAPTAPPANNGGSGGSAIANYALQYQGYPYVWAGEGPYGFDCSGFVLWVIRNTVGTNITHDMFVQYDMGTPVAYGNLQPGDIVFFQNTFRWGMSHNGVYIGNGKFIHAENETTGVRISDITSDYYASRYYGAVRFT